MDCYIRLCIGRNYQKRLHIDASLYTMLQALSLALFAKSTINLIVENIADEPCDSANARLLNLFDQISGQQWIWPTLTKVEFTVQLSLPD